MDAAGVYRAILVPPSWEGERNDLVIEAAQQHPDRFGVMGRFDPDAPGAADRLASWKQQPGMLGLRFTFRRPQLAAPLVEGKIDWVWAAAEKYALPVMVMVSQSQTQHIDRIAGRHPQLRFVMDHMTLTSGQKDEEAFADSTTCWRLRSTPISQ